MVSMEFRGYPQWQHLSSFPTKSQRGILEKEERTRYNFV